MPKAIGPGSQRTAGHSKHSGSGNRPFDEDPVDASRAFIWAFDVYRADLSRVALPVVVVEIPVMFATLVVPRFLGHLLGSTTAQYLSGALFGILGCTYAATSLYPYLLNVARGRPVEFFEALRPTAPYLSTLKLVVALSVAVTLGLLLCAVPGIIVMILSAIALPTLIDRDLDWKQACRESFGQARAHPLPMTFFGLSVIAVTLAGAALCIVGAVFVSVPVVTLAQIHVYLRSQGELPIDADRG